MKKWVVGFGVIIILAVAFYLFRTFSVKSQSPEGTADYTKETPKSLFSTIDLIKREG